MALAPASQVAPAYRARCVRVGEWRVTALGDGSLRLDGGSMWGVVPAVMWRELTPPAEDNTILLALRPFLAERGDARVLIEGGVGARWAEKWRRIYRIEATSSLDESLAACGLAPEDVTHVVASHCHWDHVGSLVVERDGALVPHFPRARHFAPRSEVAIAKRPGHARSGSYRAEDVAPLEAAGVLATYEGEAELLPGLRVHPAYGHSDGIHLVTLASAGETAVFWSDVVPTAHHVQPPYIMAYDIDVVRSFETRSAWLARAAREDWLGLFYHDPDVAFGRLAFDGRRYACTPVAGEAR
jgi:glyoxylase-like metal-dependent hydrolase (beta-lactamase superfamily II)